MGERIIDLLITGGLASLLSVLSTVAYFKANRRIKNAEADEKELDNVKAVIQSLKEQINFLSSRVDTLQRELGERDQKIKSQNETMSLQELKYQQKKSCISRAYHCEHVVNSESCPVLNRQRDLEEDYLRSLEKTKKP